MNEPRVVDAYSKRAAEYSELLGTMSAVAASSRLDQFAVFEDVRD